MTRGTRFQEHIAILFIAGVCSSPAWADPLLFPTPDAQPASGVLVLGGGADLTITLATERAGAPMLLNQPPPRGWLTTLSYSTQFPAGVQGAGAAPLGAYSVFPADELTWAYAPPASVLCCAGAGELLIARIDAGAPTAGARP